MSKPNEYRDLNFKPTLFNQIEEAIAAASDPRRLIALHVGDTWFDLPDELTVPMENEPWNALLSRYGSTQGEIELRRRLHEKVVTKNKLPLSGPKELQLVFGATGGLFLAMKRLLEPGDEILTLAPYWAILRVVASTAGAKLVEVPLFDRLPAPEDPAALEALLEPYRTEKTAAIYFNSPNNPSGVLLREGHLQTLADYAKKHNLWVLSDEAYEDFIWNDEPHVSIGSLKDMFERTVSIYSMSKSYAAAGLRLGCIAAPKGVIAALNPTHVGVGYEPNRLAQVQWIRGLERSESVIPKLHRAYREGRQAVLDNCDVPFLAPEGSFYVFLDLRDKWAGLTGEEKLERMLKAGVVLSTGEAFGHDYDGWARFCYTAEPPELIAEAARRASNL